MNDSGFHFVYLEIWHGIFWFTSILVIYYKFFNNNLKISSFLFYIRNYTISYDNMVYVKQYEYFTDHQNNLSNTFGLLPLNVNFGCTSIYFIYNGLINIID